MILTLSIQVILAYAVCRIVRLGIATLSKPARLSAL